MWFFIVGIIALILGFLYSFKPNMVGRLNQMGMKTVLNPVKFIEKRKLVSVLYFLAGLFLLSIAILK